MSSRPVTVLVWFALAAAIGVDHVQAQPPAWDTKGTGPLPRQGIACLDVAPDGTIVVGTIAPAGQPNVFSLDAAGTLISQHAVGQRWIGEVVAIANGWHHALCTTPAGKAEDVPTVFSCTNSVVEIPSQLGQSAYPRTVFHYGDHSNHSGTHVIGFEEGAVALYGNRVEWIEQRDVAAPVGTNLPIPAEAVTVSLAVHRSGTAVVGCAVSKQGDSTRNLFVTDRKQPKPAWSRAPLENVAEAARLEKGRYGKPTLLDGRRDELPQDDVPVLAPLSVAVDRETKLTRIATADYRGRQRWIRSSATGQQQNYGTRFVPTSPTVTVYDSQGNIVRQFRSERFGKATWVDLAFLPDARHLIAYPHHWTCRGLAGQTVLPADDDAKTIWWIDVEADEVRRWDLPEAVCDVAVGEDGSIAVTCWNGQLYRLKSDSFHGSTLPEGTEIGGPALVAARPLGGFVVARTSGRLRLIDSAGRTQSEIDLNEVIEPATPKWVTDSKATRIAEKLWQLPGGRVESDLGGQRVIEAPDGLILIEGHAGLSFEREWASIESAGLDPRNVRHVLATHEHGDHAPGAYLWRVTTGAQFVCSDEMAYTLQHHIPLSTGYGLHPPVPTDVRIAEEKPLDLAGMQVTAVRLPGHTYGSMGWLFAAEGKKYVAIGDLIMPEGALGYAGSINFSATDVLASLRKLDRLKVDFILPGHGPITGPDRYIASGIGVGRHVGWGKIRPEDPDPRYRLSQQNVQVVAWNIDATSADTGDLNRDRRPDIAVVIATQVGSTIQIFLNHAGQFRETPDHVINVPGATNPSKLRIRDLNGDQIPDFLVGGSESALVLSKPSQDDSQKKIPEYEVVAIGLGEGNQARRSDIDGDGQPDVIVAAKFGSFSQLLRLDGGRVTLKPVQPTLAGPYVDVVPIDLNGDQRDDFVSSYGHVLLRDAKGKLPDQPSLKLPIAAERDWSFLGIGDFNADGRPDITLSSYGQGPVRTFVYTNRGQPDQPFSTTPDATLELDTLTGEKKLNGPLLRDSIQVADYDGDGIDDLIVGKGQDQRCLVLLGNTGGLSLDRSIAFDLDYRLHYETGLMVADFNGDGRLDVAALGNTKTGVGAGGPLAVYIYLQVSR